MKKFKKIIAVIASAVIAAALPVFNMYADENYDISSKDPRYKYLINDDGTISIAASEYSKLGVQGDVVLPDMLDGRVVSGICKSGFLGCELTSVTVPESVTDIGSLAFANCLTLSQITLNDNITHMGELAFSNTGYETALFENADSDFAIIDDYILYLYIGEETDITVPNGIKVIANSAFANNGVNSDNEISTVVLPDGVTHIGENAFENCSKLSKMTIKTGLESVGSNAISSNMIIYGYIGTYAQEFATANGNPFVPLIAEGKFEYECEYAEGFKQYYFSTDTEFSKEGIKVYKRNYDGTREEVTDWKFTSNPAELYAQTSQSN